MSQSKDPSPRFGIGELYGYDLLKITPDLRRSLAEQALKPKSQRLNMPCPFQPGKVASICKKAGGVCSLRQYSFNSGEAQLILGPQGGLRATCPKRFYEADIVTTWVGEEVINDSAPAITTEVGFLKSCSTTDSVVGDDVGRFDLILFSEKTPPEAEKRWVPVEVQSVYFSGDAMRPEFESLLSFESNELGFPVGRRRPDYRSSATKRLSPQLQTKATSLRRWGKKIAVVVDRAFFDSIGEIETVDDISNADIAWFIVGFDTSGAGERSLLVRDEVRFTTLEKACEVLTGGKPISLREFEKKLMAKLSIY